MLLVWAIHPNFFYGPLVAERCQIRSCHTAGTEHPDNAGVFSRHVTHAEPCPCADAHVLEVPVVDDSQWLPIDRAEQEDQSTVGPWLDAVLILGPIAVGIDWPRHDVGLHSDREHTQITARTLHRAPTVVVVFTWRWHVHVDTRAVDRAAVHEASKSRVQSVDGVFDRQHLPDGLVVNEQHRILLVTSKRFRPRCFFARRKFTDSSRGASFLATLCRICD